jgi:hypothetical protein
LAVLRVNKTSVSHHRVVEVRTADGAVIEMSAGHPTADGRLFVELRAGDQLDGALIVSALMIDYRFSHTYDILPASQSGTYCAIAAGAAACWGEGPLGDGSRKANSVTVQVNGLESGVTALAAGERQQPRRQARNR